MNEFATYLGQAFALAALDAEKELLEPSQLQDEIGKSACRLDELKAALAVAEVEPPSVEDSAENP